MRSKWHFSIILHSEFDSAYPKNPGKRSTNKVLPCLIRLTLTFMFWPLTSRNKVKMTSNQKPPIGFGFSTPENPRIRIFSKCIRILAPQIKYEFYALSTPYKCYKTFPFVFRRPLLAIIFLYDFHIKSLILITKIFFFTIWLLLMWQFRFIWLRSKTNHFSFFFNIPPHKIIS